VKREVVCKVVRDQFHVQISIKCQNLFQKLKSFSLEDMDGRVRDMRSKKRSNDLHSFVYVSTSTLIVDDVKKSRALKSNGLLMSKIVSEYLQFTSLCPTIV
jgi:hypothetical protein